MLDKETADRLWKERVHAAGDLGESNDCTVKALSIACDVPYTLAHEALRLAGRKPRKGCRWPEQWEALTSLGYVAYDLTNHVDGKTTITLERELRKRFPNGRFLIGVRGHRMAMRDGHMIDHAKGSRRRIQTVYMIFPADHEQPKGYEFERTRLITWHETTDEPYVTSCPVEFPEPEPEPEPVSQPLRTEPRSRKVRGMTTKIRATGAEHPITSARLAFGLSTNELGKLVGFPGASLWRIERGLNVPRREVAREIHKFFGGALPLGAIYDGAFWLDETPGHRRESVLAELAALGREYRSHKSDPAGREPAPSDSGDACAAV